MEYLERSILEDYFFQIKGKIQNYIDKLNDGELSGKPKGCDLSRLCLILGQFRH